MKIFAPFKPDGATVRYFRFTISPINDGDIIGSTSPFPPDVVVDPTTGTAWAHDFEDLGTDVIEATNSDPETEIQAAIDEEVKRANEGVPVRSDISQG